MACFNFLKGDRKRGGERAPDSFDPFHKIRRNKKLIFCRCASLPLFLSRTGCCARLRGQSQSRANRFHRFSIKTSGEAASGTGKGTRAFREDERTKIKRMKKEEEEEGKGGEDEKRKKEEGDRAKSPQ